MLDQAPDDSASAPAANAGYEGLFDQRGAAYDHAMERFPDARREEFAQAIARAALPAAAVVVDVPAGGGYLARYLPAGCTWRGHEPCESFGHGAGAPEHRLLPLPWEHHSADAALSIAGLHHLDDKVPLFAELARVVKPGGRFVFADVHEGSAPARFLEGWVHRHNSTGHRGLYPGPHTLGELARAGWRVVSAERVAFHWRFANRAAMGEFCHALFDLRRATPAATAATIEAELGVDEFADGVGMRWELFMVAAVK